MISRIWHGLIAFEWLDKHTAGRDNNYTLIRLVASTAVIFGHSYRLSPIPGLRDPVGRFFHGTWSGAIAVEAFFFISGLLVCASVIHSKNTLVYLRARILRLMPALLVCLLITVFLLGPLLSSLPVAEYFASAKTWDYLSGNASLIKPVFPLPGVFEDNPRPGVNGSLWTLPAEARMYLLLGAAGLTGLMQRRWSANLLLAVLVSTGLFWPDYLPLVSDNPRYFRLAAYFATGVFFYINRTIIPLNWVLLSAALLASVIWRHSDFGLSILGLTICYAVACVAYLPNWGWPSWMGDYSYGLYIYAWPSQQLAWLAVPDTLPMHNALLALSICLPLAILSWHLIEKPALKLKNRPIVPGWLKTGGKRPQAL